MKVLIVQNSEFAGAGLFAEFLVSEHNATVTVIEPRDILAAYAQVHQMDLFVLLGSPHSVYERDVAWIDDELGLVKCLVKFDRPLIGICFGAQLIARAVGGAVGPMGRRDEGWIENDEVVSSLWRGPWMRWHGDQIEVPPNATVLARSGSTIQAFQIGRAVGVQFHPEVDTLIVSNWVAAGREELLARGVELDALAQTTLSRCELAELHTYPLFRELLQRSMSGSI
jgi:GMP synthase (glutamine-hydrolysing)